MKWEAKECPYFDYEPCAGEVKVVDEGEGYIVVACEKHAELVARGVHPWDKPVEGDK